MAYIRKEELPARHIGNKLIPPLTKFYRADGSFDVFDMTYAPCNLQWLCKNHYAGFRHIRCNGILNNTCDFGEYQSINEGVSGTINTVYIKDTGSGGHYSSLAATTVLKLKLDNPMGLVPVYIYILAGANGDEDNASTTVLNIYDYNEKLLLNKTGGRSEQTWDVRNTFPPDYKDIFYIWAGAGSRGGGKFPGCVVISDYRFVRRLPHCTKDIYRIYS